MNAIEWTAEQAMLTCGKTLADKLEVIAERQLKLHGYVTMQMVANAINRKPNYIGDKWYIMSRKIGIKPGGKIVLQSGKKPVNKWVRA